MVASPLVRPRAARPPAPAARARRAGRAGRLLVLLLAWTTLLGGTPGAAAQPPGPAPAGPGTDAGGPAPKAVVPASEHDAGVTAVGESVTHEFLVENAGQIPLTLREPRASRGAAVVRFDPILPPGATGRVTVQVDGWALLGPSALTASVVTNDPARPRLDLHLRVDVRPFVVARPGYARYLFVQGAREGAIAQTLAATDGADFRVLEVRSPYPFLRVTAREAAAAERLAGLAGRQWRVEATIASTAAVGPLADFVVIRVDHPRQKEVRVPVTGFVRPMFAVTPPAATLGDVDPRRTARTSLHVKNFAEEPVELTGVSSDVPGIEASLAPVEPGRAYWVRLTVSPDAPPGPFAGTLRIRTASPKQPAIEVPLTGRVVAPATSPAPRP